MATRAKFGLIVVAILLLSVVTGSMVFAQGGAGWNEIFGDLHVQGQQLVDNLLEIDDAMLIDGDSDEVQLRVQGNSTQTSNTFVVETSAGTDLFWVTNVGDAEMNGTTPYLTIGDAGAEDAGIVYDGAAQDFNISLDDTADDLVIGLGSAAGTTDIIVLDENQDVGLGGASAGSKLDVTGNVLIDGAADEVQFTVQGNSTQTSAIDLLVVETSAGTDVFQVGVSGQTENVTADTDGGALAVTAGVYLLGGGSAQAFTIVAPTATTHDGLVIRFVATTAQAHTITATTIGFNAGDAGSDVCTLGGAIGDSLTVTAYQGEWYVTGNINCTLG